MALLRPVVDTFSSAAMVLSCGALSWVAGSRDMVKICRNSSRGGNMYDHCEGCTHVTVAVQGYATSRNELASKQAELECAGP